MDVQVAIHTDTLNEGGYVEDTIAAFEGRTIHTYHAEGAGGGHAPDVLKVVGEDNVLPSSTNPTLPYGVNTQAELFDMIMVCHNLNPNVPSDVAFAESRVRAETIAAENVLHDMGVISMFSSDSQAMGRIGENWLRAIQTADAMKRGRGKLPEDAAGNDNFRVLRYIAKVTINPALTVRHRPRPRLDHAGQDGRPRALVAGHVRRQAEAGHQGRDDQLGASWATRTRRCRRPSRSPTGRCSGPTAPRSPGPRVTFVSKASYDLGIGERYGLQKDVVPVYGTRTVTKRDMVRNDVLPKIEVDPETFAVKVDGKHATVDPVTDVKLNQLYFFS